MKTEPRATQAAAEQPKEKRLLAVRTHVRCGDDVMDKMIKSMHDMQMTPIRNLRG